MMLQAFLLSFKWGALPPKLGELAPNCGTLHYYFYFIDVVLCPLVVVIPLGLLYIPRKSSHLNHVLYLVFEN